MTGVDTKPEFNVWLIGPLSVAISSVSESTASIMAEEYPQAIFFFADLTESA